MGGPIGKFSGVDHIDGIYLPFFEQIYIHNSSVYIISELLYSVVFRAINYRLPTLPDIFQIGAKVTGGG